MSIHNLQVPYNDHPRHLDLINVTSSYTFLKPFVHLIWTSVKPLPIHHISSLYLTHMSYIDLLYLNYITSLISIYIYIYITSTPIISYAYRILHLNLPYNLNISPEHIPLTYSSTLLLRFTYNSHIPTINFDYTFPRFP